MSTWRTKQEDGPGEAWHAQWRFWRVQFGWHVYRHNYKQSPDRWVFQPYLIFDRGEK